MSGWPLTRLGDIAGFERGLTYKKADEVEHSSVVVLRANNVDLETGQLVLDELRFLRDDLSVPAAKQIKRESLLVCTASGSKSHLGKVALIDTDSGFAFGGFMGRIDPQNGVLPKFLYYCLRSNSYTDFIQSLTDGTNINNLKWADLREFQIPLPPLDEQKRIVTKLDKVTREVSQLKSLQMRQRSNIDALWAASMSEKIEGQSASEAPEPAVSEWQVAFVKDLCESVNVGFVGPSSDVRDDSGVPFLMGKNVGPGFLKLDNLDRIDPHFHEDQKKSQLRSGDVVVVRIGNSGQAVRIPENLGAANCAGLVIIKQPKGIDADFLVYYLNSPQGRAYSLGRAGGSTRQTLNTKTVANTPVPLPPLDEQKRVVAELDAIRETLDTLREQVDSQMQQYQSFRNAVLAQAVSVP